MERFVYDDVSLLRETEVVAPTYVGRYSTDAMLNVYIWTEPKANNFAFQPKPRRILDKIKNPFPNIAINQTVCHLFGKDFQEQISCSSSSLIILFFLVTL